MRVLRMAILAFVLMGAGSSVGAKTECVSATRGCPSIVHAPLVSVVRGTPPVITATVDCPTGTLVDVILQVRLTDLGKPSPVQMVGEGDGLYKATVPVSMLQGLPRFWYYIDAKGKDADGEDTVAQTVWHPVNIIDPGQGSEGGGGDGKKALYWLAGGAAVLGGAAIIENNDGSGDGNKDGDNNDAPPPSDGGGESDSSSQEKDSCVLTGDEDAFITNTKPCLDLSDIEVFFCGTCPNANVTVVTSWGVVRQRNDSAAHACPPINTVPIYLPKPGFPDGPESETINVFVNGSLIKQFRWPSSAEYFNCL